MNLTFQSAFKGQFEPELGLLIQLVLYRLSVWQTGASYGAKLQGLRYAYGRSSISYLSCKLFRLLGYRNTDQL